MINEVCKLLTMSICSDVRVRFSIIHSEIYKDLTFRKLMVLGLFIAFSGIVNAEIVTDGSVGLPSASIVGPNFDINASLGQQAGNNLFHSFSTFNIATGESVSFSGPAAIQNIINRVTGNDLSTIDGSINSSISGANLWLINPNGVVFGSNASLNISGSFHVSTGEYVALEDGSQYQVGQNSNINLLTASPEGFGFLTQAPAPIFINNSNLSVATGQALSFVGGDVDVNASTLQATDGRINIASLSSPGEVIFTLPADNSDSGISVSNGPALSEINIVDSTIDGTGDGGARIYLKGGNIVLDATSKVLNGNVNTMGGVIHISGTDVLLDGSLVKTESTGSVKGADIIVRGQELVINNPVNDILNSGLVSKASNSATGGDVRVDVENSVTLNTGIIRSYARNSAVGGNVEIDSKTLNVLNDSKIFTNTFFNGGVSGSININAIDNIHIDGGNSLIEIETWGSSNAGSIDLVLNTGDLVLSNGAQISTDSFTAGIGAGIQINADSLTLSSNSYISAESTYDTGQGINISLQDDLSLSSGAYISSDTFDIGQGSNINISAGNVSINNGAYISSSTKRDGNAGSINLTLNGDLSINGLGDGQTGLFSVSGDPVFNQNPPFIGNGGSINVDASSISIDKGIISSKAINIGDAGNINLNTTDKIVLNNAEIVTSAIQSAGGNISINAINLLSLNRSGITAEAFGVTIGNDGGNISIDPINVVLNSSDVIARANAGNGGNITIVTEALTQSTGSVIDASSQTGLSGEIRIESANEEVNATEYRDIDFIDVVSMLTKSCNRVNSNNKSSFIVLNNGGLPLSPGDVISSSDYYDVSTLSLAEVDKMYKDYIALDNNIFCSLINI